MSGDKMTNKAMHGCLTDLSQLGDSVVQALEHTIWSEVDAESKIRAKLEEFAAELQTIKTIKDTL